VVKLPIQRAKQQIRSTRERGMSPLKKILLTMMVLGGVGSTISAGTFASFNAATTNANSSFASGSLVLGRQVESGTVCLSTGGGTTDSNTNTCDLMISPDRVKIGDAATSVKLTINNAGSLTGTLNYNRNGSCASATNNVYWTGGTGNLCTSTNLTIQEYESDWTTKKTACIFPSQPSTVCTTLNDSYAVTTGSRPEDLPTTATSLGTLTAGSSRYFMLSMHLPNNTSGGVISDEVQGRLATFALSWSLSQ
jgi:hypothetical protein